VRWLTKIVFFLLIGCCNLSRYSHCETLTKQDDTIPIVLHLRSEKDLDVATKLLSYPKKTLLAHGINVYIDRVIFREEGELDIVGTPEMERSTLDEDEKIHIFFIDSLYGDDGEQLYGLHVNFSNRCKSYILIPDETTLSTIAHEIGHEFGLIHTEDRSNIMRSGERASDATFTKEQANIIREGMLSKRKSCY